MATIDIYRPREIIDRKVISNDPLITVELVTFKLTDDDGYAYGCRAWSSIHSRITDLYDNEQEAITGVRRFKIAIPATDNIAA